MTASSRMRSRGEGQVRAFRLVLQTLGDPCSFGINYFDLENLGYVKTATEVSADAQHPLGTSGCSREQSWSGRIRRR